MAAAEGLASMGKRHTSVCVLLVTQSARGLTVTTEVGGTASLQSWLYLVPSNLAIQ